ncbi:hypothetical protein NPM17_26170, partial [Escherichia coli]|nr:hypothetical protein [Escherichia coli]
ATSDLHAIDTTHKVIKCRVPNEVSTLNQHSLRLQHDVAKNLKASPAQGCPSLDHVSNCVGTAESDRRLNCAIQVDKIR